MFEHPSFPRPLAVIVDAYLPFKANHDRKADVQDTLTGQQMIIATLAVPMKALGDAPQIAEAIQKGVNTFMEAVPVLMKALDAVAKVHPFISSASPFFGTQG
jgi:hypothetical protein